MKIKFRLDKGAYAPVKAHSADAGFDLRAMEGKRFGKSEIFDTGVHIEIPKGYAGFVKGRSGLNFNQGIICPDGTVDSGFSGSIKVKLYNTNTLQDAEVKAGDRIAQLVIQPLADAELIETDELEETERGANGFGSSGR